MSKHLVTIERFATPFEASMAKNRLEAEGIPAFLADEQTVGNLWQMGPALGGVKLLVPDDCIQKAMDVLTTPPDEQVFSGAETDAPSDLDSQAIQAARTCPRCGNQFGPEEGFCPNCGSAGETKTELKTINDAAESGNSVEEDAALDVPLPPGDELALRAWRTAAFGLLFFPLTFYSSWLLIRLFFYAGELSPQSIRRMLGAMALDALVLILLYIVVVLPR
jgi:hypothetical protein